MQTLIQALKNRFEVWPDNEEFFTCDPDGEVRGGVGINNDFYPSVEICEIERCTKIGSMDV